jgi:hypothetical protein
MTEERIRSAINALSVAVVAKIDIIERTNPNGEKYKRVFVHFAHWYDSEHAVRFRNDLLAGKELNIMYDNPWYWKITASKWSSGTNHNSTVKLGSNNTDTNTDKNVDAVSSFMEKLSISSSQEDNRPYSVRRTDPIYVAQDMAQGFCRRYIGAPRAFIAPPTHTSAMGPSISIAPCLEGFGEAVPKRRADVEDRQRRGKRIESTQKQEAKDRRSYQEEERYIAEQIVIQEEVNRHYQNGLIEEEEMEAIKLAEITEMMEEHDRRIEEKKLEDERQHAIKLAKNIEAKKQAIEVEKRQRRETARLASIAEYFVKYADEKKVYDNKNEETRAYIESLKRADPSTLSNRVPNAQIARDSNEDFSLEFKGSILPEYEYTMSFGDEPLPPAFTRANRKIVE